ncbi:hypothetical protein CCH79_00002644, partial [Gambusia affinis]
MCSDRTPLHEAAYQGRLLHLKTLMAQVNTLTLDGVSSLHEAWLTGRYACAKVLLDDFVLRHCQQMALHLSLTPAAVEITEPPSTPTTSWLHPSTKPLKKVTESVWSCCCCCRAEPRLIFEIPGVDLILYPAVRRLQGSGSGVPTLALDVGRSALCMLRFVLEKQTLLNFSWTSGQTEPAGMQREKLLSICRHQTARFDLLWRRELPALCLSFALSAFAAVLGDLVFAEPPASSFLTVSGTSSSTNDTSVCYIDLQSSIV